MCIYRRASSRRPSHACIDAITNQELLKVTPDWSHERIRGIAGFSTRRHASLYILQKRPPFFSNQPAVLGHFVKNPHTQNKQTLIPSSFLWLLPRIDAARRAAPLRIPSRRRAPRPPPRPMGRDSRGQRLTGWPRMVAMVSAREGSTSSSLPSPPHAIFFPARVPSWLEHGKPCDLCSMRELVRSGSAQIRRKSHRHPPSLPQRGSR